MRRSTSLSLLVCSQTSLRSAVLATAAEGDEGGRERASEQAGGKGGGGESGFLYGTSLDTSQYLMEMDLFR